MHALIAQDMVYHGAIMSIMGSNLLTNIIYYQNYLDPNKILARLDKLIKMELQQGDVKHSRDGMEIGICVINLDDLENGIFWCRYPTTLGERW